MSAERIVEGTGIPGVRKPIMTLYAGTTDPYSHRTRIVLYEKDVECQIVEVDVTRKPREPEAGGCE